MSDLSREQLRNASIIYQVGQQLGASRRDIQIALITALTESNLINVNYGDRDSLGLFQQRAAWAPAHVRMDPWQSAKMFFLGGQQGQRGLFDFKDRNQMGMGEAAQAVQVSAFPDRYATKLGLVRDNWPQVVKAGGGEVRDMDGNEYGNRPDRKQPKVDHGVDETSLGAPEFKQTLGAPQFGGLAARGSAMLSAPQMTATGAVVSKLPNPNADADSIIGAHTSDYMKNLMGEKRFAKGLDGWRKGVVEMARQYVGTPYVWGGASPDGFDCSGIIQYVYGKLGMDLPRVSYQQANFGKRVGLGKLRPGDLVAWDNSTRNNGADHIAIYIGNGQILESPRPGLSVRIRNLGESEGAWGVKLDF